MTNNEAIARIKEHIVIHKIKEPRAICITEALKKAVKALERESILDKIMEEIKQMPSELTADGRRMIRRESIFRIIDKYKPESENEE